MIHEKEKTLQNEDTKEVQKDTGFHQFISQKGTAFTSMFYVFLLLFLVSMIIGILKTLMESRFIELFILLVISGLGADFILKRNLYGLLLLIFLLSPLGVLIWVVIPLTGLPLLMRYIPAGASSFYALISVYTLILGFVTAFMFGRVCEDSKKYIGTAVVFSSVLGAIFAVLSVLEIITSKITEGITHLSPSESVIVPPSPIYNVKIAFILAIVFLNIPYIALYLKTFSREIENKKIFLLYITPLVVFLLLQFLLIKIIPIPLI